MFHSDLMKFLKEYYMLFLRVTIDCLRYILEVFNLIYIYEIVQIVIMIIFFRCGIPILTFNVERINSSKFFEEKFCQLNIICF